MMINGSSSPLMFGCRDCSSERKPTPPCHSHGDECDSRLSDHIPEHIQKMTVGELLEKMDEMGIGYTDLMAPKFVNSKDKALVLYDENGKLKEIPRKRVKS